MDLSQWLEYIQRQHPESIELGLDRVREVATRLGLGRPAAQVITTGLKLRVSITAPVTSP